jgi:hypothetical protein
MRRLDFKAAHEIRVRPQSQDRERIGLATPATRLLRADD